MTESGNSNSPNNSSSGPSNGPSGERSGGPQSPPPEPGWQERFFGSAPGSRRDSIFLGPHGLRAGWGAALYIAFFLAFLLMAAGIESLFKQPLLPRGGFSTLSPGGLAYQELLSVVGAIAAAAVMGKIEKRSFAEFGLPPRRAFRWHYWQGALWGLGQVSLLIALIAAFKGYSLGMPAIGGAEILRYALEWLGAFALVGVFEEFFFRGYLQSTLTRGMGFWPAALLLSAGFGAVHLMNPGEGPAGAAGVFVVGLFLCFTLRRTGSLWFAIGWHAAFDFGETYLYSVPDSGLVTTHQLFHASLRGPHWLTGGSVGPEGSVFAFITLALGFVLFALLYPSEHDSTRAGT